MKIIILIACIFLFSCTTRENYNRTRDSRSNSKVESQSRFKVGDIVYLKPDSTKAVVEKVVKCGCLGNEHRTYEYRLYYFTKDGEKRTEDSFDEALIY